MRKDRPHFVLRENPGLQVQRYHHATSTRPWHGQWQMRLTRKARVRRGPTPMQLLTAHCHQLAVVNLASRRRADARLQ